MQKGEYSSRSQYDKIQPAVLYIEEKFLNQKLSVGYLAKICNISESYLKKLFIKNFGVSPIKYIIGLKINYSCDLLRSGLYNITKVSGMCGYANLYYFSTQLKEHMGITPTDFIKKYRSSKN
ncbi:MAG: helix-turn-helix transcriptional regulator [Clostridia bacterium]|nr:helix-turn-helix transcriptional regulator [Clostridia bacterium]